MYLVFMLGSEEEEGEKGGVGGGGGGFRGLLGYTLQIQFAPVVPGVCLHGSLQVDR